MVLKETNRLAREYPKKRLFGDNVLELSNRSGSFQLTYYKGVWFNGQLKFVAKWRWKYLNNQEQEAFKTFNEWKETADE